ncbi:hypothetical protein QJS04_geneDACA022300 [Acorus gramineus]|uniref:3'-5' exonuclease domain-containing protein n=1 Tax=Acorus gramineus TaxID=55184 RepID=A0AAV9B829_ACOGR|nr:hypothetical protein QJS04_geneDACA022300 [Acorus gramineus]
MSTGAKENRVMEDPSTITIEDLPYSDSRFMVHFFDDAHIATVVTASAEEASEWVEAILWVHRRRLSRLIVGLDVEWRPNLSRGENNPVAVLQLCVGQRCLVFQLLHCRDIPYRLSNFLSNRKFKFMVVGIDKDFEKLSSDYNLEVANTIDLRVFAAEVTGRRELR